VHPYRLSDDFSGTTVDPTIWHTIISGTGATIAETGGQVQIELQSDGQPGGAYNVLGAHYGTQCKFPGDFDAQVDYSLLDWPKGSGVLVDLAGFFGNGGVGRQGSAKWGDNYTSWVEGNGGSFPTADLSGSLRLARAKGIMTGYVWHNGRWVRLATGPATGAVVLGLDASAGAADWMHEHVLVAFDNFVATAKTVDCPVGSLPPQS
jgi:hypothetical protein